MALVMYDAMDDMTFEKGNIYGFFGEYPKEIFTQLYTSSKTILEDQKLSDIPFKKRYSLISYASLGELYFYTKTVKSEFRFLKEYREVDFDEDKIIQYLQLVGLDSSYLTREIKTLSYSEKIQLYLALHLILPFEVFILEDIYAIFDLKIRKKIEFILKELKEEGKFVIVALQDVNVLYSLTDCVYCFQDQKVTIYGKSKDLFTNIPLLQKNHVEIPYLSLIPYLAKKQKDVKLFYRTDLRDTIKDIYKHV